DIRMAGTLVYHPPCHDSLDGKGEELLRRMAPDGVVSTPHCCSEAGTLALSRPDIAAAMLDRKRAALAPHLAGAARPHRLLTNCPACLNGLGRQGLAPPAHLATALADAWGKENWRAWTFAQLARAELIRF
ncbi:MAG: FAD-linked oxidase, partial [Thermodesulfobacteriota bacterium]